jgi:hypothetical protein
MALRLSTSSTNIGRNQRNSNAKFAATPQRHNKVMVEQIRERNYWKLGRPHKAIYKQLQVNIQATSINRRSQSVCATMRRNTAGIHPKMESYQKLSSQILDKRAIDVFIIGLRRRDLIEEIGRMKPKTVLDLMDIANRFADAEDACNNKRTRSLEDDRRNRYGSQRRRSHNYDNYGSHSQVTAGYKDNSYQGSDRRSSGY